MLIEFPRYLMTVLLHASQRLRAVAARAGQTFILRSRWGRLTMGLLAALLALLVLLNVALSLGAARPFLARLISESPQSFNIDYRRAWSFWPALVSLRKVVLSGSDANVEWQIEIEEARVSIDLLALLHREFHATHVKAQGIGFRLRQKLDLDAATSDRVAPLPLISGFEDRPLRDAPQPSGKLPKVTHEPWSVRIENVDGRAGQIWIDEFRFEGNIQLNGSFFLRPKQRLWVGPAHASIISGSVVVGQEKLLDETVGYADCTIPSFDLGPPVGMQVFRFISGNVRLDANVPSARTFDYYARFRGSSIRFNGGAGVFHLDGGLRSGIVRPLDLTSSLNDVQVNNGTWFGLGAIQLSAQAGAEGPSAWSSRIGPIELRRAGAKIAVVQAKELRIDSDVSEIDLTKPAPELLIRGDLPSANVPSLQIVNGLLSSKGQLHVDGGKASISAHLEVNTGTNSAKGVLAVRAKEFTAHDGELSFGGQLSASVQVAKLLLDSGDVELSKTVIDARDVTLRDPNAVLSDWWSSVEIHAAKIRPKLPVPLDLTWTAKIASAAPVLAFSKRAPALPGWMTRVLIGGEVKASGRLRAGKDFVELSQFRARTGLLNVEGDIRERGDATSGAFRVSAGPLSVGIELNNDETKLIFVGRPVEPPLLPPAKRATQTP